MAVSLNSSSRFVSFVAVFAALAMILDVIPIIPGFYSGIWDSWLFLLSPLFGVILGPVVGAASIALGGFLGHLIYFRDPFELIFMWGAPLGAAVSGLVYQKKWKKVMLLYSGLLMGYFITPVSWQLPLWGIWDTLFGFGVVVIFIILNRMHFWNQIDIHREGYLLCFASVIGLETDVLFRVFALVPGQTYRLFYGLSVEGLQLLWIGAGIITPLKVFIATIVVVVLGLSLLKVVSQVIKREEILEKAST